MAVRTRFVITRYGAHAMNPATRSIRAAETDCVVLTTSRTSRAMGHSCEVLLGDDALASMTGSIAKRRGQIVAGQSEFQVDAGTMLDGHHDVATYRISERFMRLTLVELFDCSSRRTFVLSQKRIWSGRLEMVENDTIVANYVPDLFHSKYRITATNETPQPIVLLSIWLTAVTLVFVGS